MKFLYLTTQALAKQLNVVTGKEIQNHYVTTINKFQVLTPIYTSRKAINPQTFSSLKSDLSISSITILDRVKNTKKNIKAGEQINRSGTTFLRGETPFENHPTFPDISQALKGTPEKQQTTVGGERFVRVKSKPSLDYFEWMAPISTVWHYIEVETFGIGIGSEETSINHFIS